MLYFVEVSSLYLVSILADMADPYDSEVVALNLMNLKQIVFTCKIWRLY